MLISIVTPTYNRAHLLPQLYKSLCRQESKEFEWVVIDDGSTDNTEVLFSMWKNEKEISLTYKKKSNGGKHTALNYSHNYIKGNLVFIVDSDDILPEDAIKVIVRDWSKYCSDENIAGITYLKGDLNAKPLKGMLFKGMKNNEKYVISDVFKMKENVRVKADSCEIIRTELFKRFPLLEYPGEKYCGESYLWLSIGRAGYKTVYANKVMYLTDYQIGGLTDIGRRLPLSSPHNGYELSKLSFKPPINIKTRIKKAWIYICYGIMIKKTKRDMIRESGAPILILINFLPGRMLYLYWKHKYRDIVK